MAPPTVQSSTHRLPEPHAAHAPASAPSDDASPVTSEAASVTFAAESGPVASCAAASIGPKLLPASEPPLEPSMPELRPELPVPELLPEDMAIPEPPPDSATPELLLLVVPVPELPPELPVPELLPEDMDIPELLPIPIEPVSAPPPSAVCPEHAAIAEHAVMQAVHASGDKSLRGIIIAGGLRTVRATLIHRKSDRIASARCAGVCQSVPSRSWVVGEGSRARSVRRPTLRGTARHGKATCCQSTAHAKADLCALMRRSPDHGCSELCALEL